MKRLPAPDMTDHDNPEWTAADFQRAKPLAEVLPELHALWKKTRGPQKAPVKAVTTIRLDADVLEAFRATGRGWQTRVNDLLRQHMPR